MTVQNGVATFNVTNMSGGTKTVRATYGGSGVAGTAPDLCRQRSQEHPYRQHGSAPPEPSRCQPRQLTSRSGQALSTLPRDNPPASPPPFTSSVGTPTGTVIFEINGQVADPAQPSTPLDANGNAVFTTGNLPVGTYSLVAVYSGDQNYSQANISVPSFRVIQPSIQITSTPATLSTPAGTPATATLSLEPLVGFNQDVGIGCVAAEYAAVLRVHLHLSGFGYSNHPRGRKRSCCSAHRRHHQHQRAGHRPNLGIHCEGRAAGNGGESSVWGLSAWAAARRRAHRYLTMLSMAFVLAGVLGGITACTNIGYSNPPPPINVITPAGTYNIQIITYNTSNSAQNSLTTPVFTLPFTVSSSGSTSTAATISRPAAVTKK